jgi:agmatine/peptidylarginine deiminase
MQHAAPSTRSRRLLHGLALLLLAGCASTGPRVVAEWEPARGVTVAYPFAVPGQLLAELARTGELFVLVREGAEERARAELHAVGVDPTRVRFVRTSVETAWTRDYGPHTVVDGDDVRLVDARYIETPIFAADAPPVQRGQELRYPGRHPGDDRTNVELAAALGLPRRGIDAYVTGGNFLVDGHGTAFCTRALLDENRTFLDDDELRRRLRAELGIRRLVVLDNTEEVGIQHVDCWLKLLDAETLLVKRVPPGVAEHVRIERNVERLRGLRTWRGTPFRILRIDCPPYGRGRTHGGDEVDLVPAYTNSLLLNRRVFVPLFGGPGDDAALATYRAALPAHEVVGIPYDRWEPFDALHCRTRAVFELPGGRTTGSEGQDASR